MSVSRYFKSLGHIFNGTIDPAHKGWVHSFVVRNWLKTPYSEKYGYLDRIFKKEGNLAYVRSKRVKKILNLILGRVSLDALAAMQQPEIEALFMPYMADLFVPHVADTPIKKAISKDHTAKALVEFFKRLLEDPKAFYVCPHTEYGAAINARLEVTPRPRSANPNHSPNSNVRRASGSFNSPPVTPRNKSHDLKDSSPPHGNLLEVKTSPPSPRPSVSGTHAKHDFKMLPPLPTINNVHSWNLFHGIDAATALIVEGTFLALNSLIGNSIPAKFVKGIFAIPLFPLAIVTKGICRGICEIGEAFLKCIGRKKKPKKPVKPQANFDVVELSQMRSSHNVKPAYTLPLAASAISNNAQMHQDLSPRNNADENNSPQTSPRPSKKLEISTHSPSFGKRELELPNQVPDSSSYSPPTRKRELELPDQLADSSSEEGSPPSPNSPPLLTFKGRFAKKEMGHHRKVTSCYQYTGIIEQRKDGIAIALQPLP